jgi:DNA polymerase III delta prime subunit
MNPTDLWWAKYEPKTLDKMILNDDLRELLGETITKVPNLMLIGPPGVGKGTFTRIFLNETKLDSIWINASKERGIDTIRVQVTEFARALGLGGLKVVVLNEADAMTPEAQRSLRDEIEFVKDITRFIFQANYGHMIIKELKSRCEVIEIDNPPATEIFNHCIFILKNENIKVDQAGKKAIIQIVKHCHPDIRDTINTLQQNVIKGKLRVKPVFAASDEVFQIIFEALKRKDLDEIRKTLRSNFVSYPDLYNYLFENVGDFKSPGDGILAIGEALRWDSLVAIKEINFMTMVMDMLKRGIV